MPDNRNICILIFGYIYSIPLRVHFNFTLCGWVDQCGWIYVYTYILMWMRNKCSRMLFMAIISNFLKSATVVIQSMNDVLRLRGDVKMEHVAESLDLQRKCVRLKLGKLLRLEC